MFHDSHNGNWPAGVDVRGYLRQLGKSLLRHFLDENIENPAAGKADCERIVVAHAIALQHGMAAADHILREGIDRRLHAAARYRADRRLIGSDQHRGSGLPRGRAPGADDGTHADGLAGPPPRQQVGEYLTHWGALQTSASTSRRSANAASECPATIRSRWGR